MDEHSLSPLDPSDLRPEQSYFGIILQEQSLGSSVFRAVALEESIIAKVTCPATDWTCAELTDVRLQRCDLANSNWMSTRLNRVDVSNCRLTGWNNSDSTLRAVHFSTSRLDLAVWHNARLEDCTFQNCDLREADFQSAVLQNIVFRNCDLRGARFAAVAFKSVDFRGSHLAGIQITPDGLSGAIVDPAQLTELARIVGLIVDDVPDNERLPNANHARD